MHRIKKAQALLQKHQLDALIIDNPVDLYYLTQEELSCGRLVLGKEEALLFVDGRYFEKCSTNLSFKTLLTSGYDKDSAFGRWWPFEDKKVGFDSQFVSVSSFDKLKQLSSNFIGLNNPLSELREIKEPEEIRKLTEAAALGSAGFDYLLTQLRVGVSERELASALKIFWLREKADGVSFSPIIAFGENSSQPHYHPSWERKLKQNELVLIDIGVQLDNYVSDMTRVVCFKQPREEWQEIYQLVYQAHTAAAQTAQGGVLIADVDRAARSLIESRGYGKLFPHGLGHGVGLEVHEPPRLTHSCSDSERLLVPNMVVTIEPGIYLPGKFGIRLEDTYVVEEKGCTSITDRPLTSKLPIVT